MRAICCMAVVATFWFSGSAAAQRNFSYRQQAGIQAYITQMQSQQRAQQQQQLRQINQQFDRQQQEMQMERNRVSRMVEGIEDISSDAMGRSYRRTRGSNSFGDMHFPNSMFMRIGPYYDYRFISARNRVNSNIGGGPSAPRF